ncbi:MAG: hypothetical protein IID51_14345, partial [Proteobacteria bacterium]|nr:hypothetical protein [Pseudomonadota bacterium]
GVGPAVSGEAEDGRHKAHDAAGGEEHIVRMLFDEETGDLLFEPARLEIKSGDTVTWIQVDEFNEHNAVSYPDGIPRGAELFEGPLLNEVGQKYSVTFTTSGTYRYHCHPHEAAGMRGVIIVDRESLAGEFREADPSEVHDHGGGMEMDHTGGMDMDMDMDMDMGGEHGDDGHENGHDDAAKPDHAAKPKEGHGHDDGEGDDQGDAME